MGYNVNFDTKCTPGFRAGCILCCPGCIFKGWGAFALGGVHLDKSEFVFALLITLIQQEQNFWLEFFSYIVNIVLQYGIRSISVSFQ